MLAASSLPRRCLAPSASATAMASIGPSFSALIGRGFATQPSTTPSPSSSPSAAAASAPAPPPNKPGSLWIWGKIEDNRMGMSLANADLGGAKAFTFGPAIGPSHNPHISNVVQVVCAASKTLALTADGSVYSWGACRNFSLGHGDGVEKVARPKKIAALNGIRIVQIAAGETSSAAVSDEGDVYTWGWGGSFWEGTGGLGHGDKTTQPRPALIESLSDGGVKMKAVSCGSRHMLGLTTEGKVWSWGNGEYGRCGNGKSEQPVPEPISLLENESITQVASGTMHNLAVTNNGLVWVWGKNDAGQLGVGGSVLMDLNTMEEYPLLLELDERDNGYEMVRSFKNKIAAVACGGNHSLAMTKEGKVFQWGQRTFLQPQPVEYGYLKASDDEEAEDIKTKKGKEGTVQLQAVKIAAGEGVSGVIDVHGDLYTWGKNLNTGMLGHTIYGTGTRRPARVDSLHKIPLADVAFGSRHAAAVVGAKAGSTGLLK